METLIGLFDEALVVFVPMMNSKEVISRKKMRMVHARFQYELMWSGLIHTPSIFYDQYFANLTFPTLPILNSEY